MNEPSHLGKALRFVGLGLVLASFLTFDVLLLLWLAGAGEAWRSAVVVGGATLLLLGGLLLLVGTRLKP